MPCPLIANADVIRVTRVDTCGRPVVGEDNGFVFDCFATLAWSTPPRTGGNADSSAASLRLFLARLMLPESAQTFARWEVVKGGKAVSSHASPEEAAEAAAKLKGDVSVKDAGMRLPDRVLVELLEVLKHALRLEDRGLGLGRPSGRHVSAQGRRGWFGDGRSATAVTAAMRGGEP
ncbi:hypothetical protein ACWGII_39665 [Streptomyces sp. NPDC054855]